ncbi:hypothetical protein HPB47_016129 [Ixodes persulcatus]|uniref:Uncharacterized protein n=1 Tax=Ixodes persulcatus TaxID=34615 RepID=A0AC60QRN1_IXOPE|nr:hypothetical protein HPB47_016129 [Ixodes persulcatus]
MAETKGRRRRGPVSAGTIVAISAAVVTIFKLSWCLADTGAYSFISELDVLTTFERKLSLLDFDAGTTDDPEPIDASVEKPLGGCSMCPPCKLLLRFYSAPKAGQSATPPAAAAPRRTAAVEKEPANVAAADSTTDEGSLFSSSSVMQFSFAELAQQGASGFGKPAGSPPKSSIPLLAGAGSKLFQSASRHKSQADEDGEEEVAPSSEVHFEPVVPLPDLVELKTGEEEEEALFCSRAKLYVFHADLKQWKERAIGDIKILKHKHRPCCFRVLMRRDQVHKIACNHAITGFIRLAPLSTSANSLTWNAIDYTDGKPSPESFAVRFKNAEILDAFAKTFEECRLAVLEKENIGGLEEAVSGRNGEQEKGEQESTEKDDEEEEEEEEEDEEDEEDDDDHGEDVMFEKRVTLAVLSPSGDSYQASE